MPVVPAGALEAAAEALRGLSLDRDGNGLPMEVCRWQARKALEAAAPAMAEHAAKAVLAHMDAYGPKTETLRRSWRRHFRIAVQVVSMAFSTEEDIKEAAAQALAEGNYFACPSGEDGDHA